jgi:phosphoglycolate phosphatase-like HAD superfamily hydrolase
MKVIALDIDRTLVDSVLTRRIKEEWKEKFEWFIYDEYTVFLRPKVREFIDFLFENNYTVGIFTAGSNNYATKIVDHLFKDYKLYFVFSNEEYDEGFDMYGKSKPMEYLVYKHPEFKVEECLLIDDSSRIKRSLGDRCYNIKKFVVCFDNADVFNPLSESDNGLVECMEWLKKE